MVDGVSIGSCLGDLYSVNWMQASRKSPYPLLISRTDQYCVLVPGMVMPCMMVIAGYTGRNPRDGT